jgi:hypothetical protein
VLSAIAQPHEPTKMHRHTANRVMIEKQAGAQIFRFSGRP